MRMAVVGLGIGKVHASVLAGMDAAELVAVCDLDKDLADSVAAQHGTRAFGDMGEMLKEAQPDGVCLCTPPKTHLPLGRQCAQAGMHLLCEKPMAASVEECLALDEAYKSAGLTLMVGQKKRFAPAFQFLKEHVGGDFGKPLSINYRYHLGQVPMAWFWAEDDGGGPIVENSVHCLDALRFVIGEIKTIRGLGGNLLNEQHAPQVDVALGLLEFENGCIGAVELGTASEWCVADEEWFIACEGAVARSRGPFDRPSEIQYVYREAQQPQSFSVDYDGALGHQDFVAEIAHFMACAGTGATPLVSGRDAAQSIACCLAMKRAVREGGVVEVQRI